MLDNRKKNEKAFPQLKDSSWDLHERTHVKIKRNLYLLWEKGVKWWWIRHEMLNAVGETWYIAIYVLDLQICLYLRIWGSAAASTPNRGTVGMCTPSSSSWRVHLLVHMFLVLFCVAAKKTPRRGAGGLTKDSWSWPKAFDYFLASEKEGHFLLWRVVSSLLAKRVLSWAAVCPGSPLCYQGNPRNVACPFSSRNSNIPLGFLPARLKTDVWRIVDLA